MKFCLCIFESDTVKSDSPVQIFRKMFKDLIQIVGVKFTSLLFLEILKKKKKSEKKTEKKKKKKKKSSENDQLTGHFQSFFIYFFSSPRP